MATDQEMSDFESSRDTSPLALSQLSDSEVKSILAIERCLTEAKDITDETSSTETESRGQPDGHPFANVQERHRRIMLLDGGRGTGKTSLLLTLVKKWHSGICKEEWAHKDEYENRLERLGIPRVEPPTHIRVIRILDFDPLPLGMPILAGIIQTLCPLAEHYERPVTYA